MNHTANLWQEKNTENSVKYGNRTSVLEEVPGFSVAVCMPHVVMHDIFEGVVHYELKLFLQYWQSKHLLSISTLNNRIRGYDFGSEDRPSIIDPASLVILLGEKFTYVNC